MSYGLMNYCFEFNGCGNVVDGCSGEVLGSVEVD